MFNFTNLLIGLMSFTCDQQDIVFGQIFNGCLNCFSAISETRSFDGGNLNCAPKLVHNQRRERFALNVFCARGLRYVVWSALGVAYGDEAIGWVEHFDVWAQNHPSLVIGLLAAMSLALVLWWRSHDEPPKESS